MAPEGKTDPDASAAGGALAEAARFEEILGRLRGLVERLEGGNLPAFEEGMELCRRGTAILDGAEKKVELLLGNTAAPRLTPFDQT
jgi:exodeoxyribonuclease VII small subunit